MTFKPTIFFLSLLLSYSLTTLNAATASHPAKDGLHLDWLDHNIEPSQDFYTYANGLWQKNNPIPPEYAAWGTFNILHERVQQLIHELLIQAAANTKATPGSIEQKVGDFYYSGMDELTINRLGIQPLQQEFTTIATLKTPADLQKEIAHLHQIGVNALFSFGSMQDFKDSKLMIGALVQDGLGLPDRDYYLNKDPKFTKIRREAYVAHVARMFVLLGDSPNTAADEAKIVMGIETQLAKASMSQIEQRDPIAIYHIKTIAELDAITPDFSWVSYFKVLHQEHLKQVNLGMPDFFSRMSEMLKMVSIDDWKIYLRWNVLSSYSSYLSEPYVAENFKMAAVLTGAEKIQPRWKRVVNTENGALGFAIGKMYIDHFFSASAREQVLAMLKNIREELRADLKTKSWMSQPTRDAALKKLDLMEERIGYPTKWWDYSRLIIDRGPYVLNVMRANEFLVQRDLAKIGKPIDRSEWGMTPQTINAYYDPSMNNLNIPAGILQPPFFDPKAPSAVNYGAIGFIMGHEMTHGFDDQGAKFDGHGNLKNWWTPDDMAKFNQATLCIINQFSQYKVDGDFPVQGKLVVGEATADLGGITLAYRAFHRSKDYQTAKTIAGMTPDQQFFLGTAHVWAMNIRPEQIRNQVTTDPHPPAKFRVNGSLANIPQFKEAFTVRDNSPMANTKRCVIW